MSKRKRLGDLLVESGLITHKQLEQTLEEKLTDQKLGDALLERGLISERQLIEVLEFQLGIPHVRLNHYPIDLTLLTLVPKETAKRQLFIPLKKEGDKLFIAMNDPMDFYTIEDLRLSTGLQIETVIATKNDLIQSINKFYGSDMKLEDHDEQMNSMDD
jgi:type IV pilus assembly protein PilB